MAEKKEGISGIHNGHRQRVWKELTKTNINENIPPHKVLELILFFTIPRKDTNELAHLLIDTFGTFGGVMDATIEQLKTVPGITEYTASHIKLILEFAKYYESSKMNDNPIIFNQKTCEDFLLKKFMGARVETTYLLCLDNLNRFISCQKLSEGDEISVGISVRQIVEICTREGATKTVLAHNHPRGSALPSQEDITLTYRIRTALSCIDIDLIDHIIYTCDDHISMRCSEKYKHLFL